MMKTLVVRVAEDSQTYVFEEGTTYTFSRPRPGWMTFSEPSGKVTILQESYVISIVGVVEIGASPFGA